MPDDVTIRGEQPADHAAIRALIDAAFDQPDEARLVDALRADQDVAIALVAQLGDRIVGHVLLSPMAAPFRALGLAPLSVAPAYQRRGVGAALVEAALAQARAADWQAAFLLGDPDYYGRFGFTSDCAAPYASPYAGPHFLARPLQGDAMPPGGGAVGYAPAFAAL